MPDTLQKPTHRERRILIIEDDPIHSRLIASELQRWYDLDFAADSESALLRLQLQGQEFPRYDLVIVDLRLPARVGGPARTEEGLRILDALHKGETSTPITIVVSGNLIDRTRQQVEALRGVVKRAFEKPFSPREIHESIDFLLGNVEDDPHPSLSQNESALLQKIHSVLPDDLRRRYNELNDKLHEETIIPEEHAELLTLIDRIELADAERMRYLIELAQLRQVSVDTLMEQLGIRRTTYV